MSSSGSSASFTSINSRLTAVASHLTSSRPKVVVCRDLGPDVMKLLYERKDLEVSPQSLYTAHDAVIIWLRGAMRLLCGLRTKYATDGGCWTIYMARLARSSF